MTQSTSNSNTNSSQAGNTTQQSNTNPWAPTLPGLHSLINTINGQPTAPTAAQQTALGQLQDSVANLPNFTNQVSGVAGGLMGGDPTGLLGSSYKTLQSQISPIANQNINPLANPIVQSLLSNIQQQVTTGTNANAAAAGRSLNSGDNAAAMSYGLASAELPQLLGQYNTNQANVLNAGNALQNAGYNTGNAMTNNMLSGVNTAGIVPQIASQNANAQLQAANTAQQLPFQNIAQRQNLLLPISGMGGQTSGSGASNQSGVANTQQTLDPSVLAMLGGIFGGGNNSVAKGILGLV